MWRSSAAAKSSYLNLRTDALVGLSSEECARITRMLRAIEDFDPALITETNCHMSSDRRWTANINELFDNYPFLGFTSNEPGVHNDGSILECRMLVWKEAHDRVESSFPKAESDFVRDFLRFKKRWSSGIYEFLPKEERGLTDEEVCSLRLEAFRQLSDWVETHLNVATLSRYQVREKRTLRQWIKSSRGKLLLQLGYQPGSKVIQEEDSEGETIQDIVMGEAIQEVAEGASQTPK